MPKNAPDASKVIPFPLSRALAARPRDLVVGFDRATGCFVAANSGVGQDADATSGAELLRLRRSPPVA